eukprot:TRINITY_DN4363_c0_g1_i3.p1 TRINITY_DN4363_c0_g1~~TRINITY_DN4363_c0_g1_i3.p1  ORF type:complete len:740 (+),score=166.52 TRINITY_DN4363_c0_g1_i3:49-2268(+)
MKRPIESVVESHKDLNRGVFHATKSLRVNIAFKPKDVEEHERIEMLRSAVAFIQSDMRIDTTREALYQAVKVLCDCRKFEKLFQLVHEAIDTHAKKIIQDLSASDLKGIDFLQSMYLRWKDFGTKNNTIRFIFIYFDRVYIKPSKDVKSIYDLGVELFKKEFEMSNITLQRTMRSLTEAIQQDRQGAVVDRDLISGTIQMIVDLQLYEDCFQDDLKRCTASFYDAESDQKARECEVPAYLAFCDNRLQEELSRIKTVLCGMTRKELVSVAEKHLIAKHSDWIIEKGFNSMMDKCSIGDLKRLYLLFSRVQKLDTLKVALSKYIKTIGSALILDVGKEQTFVQELLDFKDRVDTILRDAFSSLDILVNAVKDSFESFINTKQNKASELLAKFIDARMRLGVKEHSESETSALMDKLLIIFRYIQGKDVFEAFYKKDLSRRLLLGKSVSSDLEKTMISKLRSECGSAFTMKIEGMFRDIDLSEDMMQSFKQSELAAGLPKDLDFFVHVLSFNCWVVDPPITLRMPNIMVDCQNAFSEFYKSRYAGKHLQWQHSLGHCLMRADFTQGKKEMLVSLMQALVLLLFNDSGSLNFKSLLESTDIEEAELRRILQSLTLGKCKILTKQQKGGRDIEDDDIFSVNDEFTSKQYRIKINNFQLKDAPEESHVITEKVAQDRQYQIDAAIVRIMKNRKVLNHNLLVSELFGQLKLPIGPLDAKKRIESLIEREFLERDKADSTVYHYLT